MVRAGRAAAAMVAAAMAATFGSVAAATTTWTPLDMSGAWNHPAPQINPASFPEGPQVLACVPFELGENDGLWCWHAAAAGGANPRILEVAAGIEDARVVHLLVNTYWGSATPGLARVELVGVTGAVHAVPLLGNDDIRDYNQRGYTNSINGLGTIEVWTNGSGQRMDRVAIPVPESLDGGSLAAVRVVDEGADGVQRVFVAAITVGSGGDPADIDGDGTVGFGDLLAVLASWGPCGDPCPEDLDCDGEVGFDDVLAVLADWSA